LIMTAARTLRLVSAGLLALAWLEVASVAKAQVIDQPQEPEHSHEVEHTPPVPARREGLFAAGVRVGFMPPLFTVAELLVRPTPHFALGAFGMAWHEQFTVGAELLLEASEPGYSTIYVQGAYLYYADTASYGERSNVLYFTAGYIWKFDVALELQLGAGALLVVSDEIGPCETSCSELDEPKLLPTIDLALRYRFL
jgi:hypothetical protein